MRDIGFWKLGRFSGTYSKGPDGSAPMVVVYYGRTTEILYLYFDGKGLGYYFSVGAFEKRLSLTVYKWRWIRLYPRAKRIRNLLEVRKGY